MKKGSGLGSRIAAGSTSAVAAGLSAALEEAPAAGGEPKGEVVALNIRLPKSMHRTLRKIAFDEETSINALLIGAAERMLANRE